MKKLNSQGPRSQALPRVDQNQELLHSHHKPSIQREPLHSAGMLLIAAKAKGTLPLPHKTLSNSKPLLGKFLVYGALKVITVTA